MRGETERVAIVTGGGSGIGKAIAKVFAIDSSVVIIGRDESKLKAAVEELGPRVIWQRADVSRREDVADAVEVVIKQLGKIDVLVNNAGFARGITTEMQLEQAEALWDEVVATNLKGAFLMVMAAARYLPRPGGRIINISSNRQAFWLMDQARVAVKLSQYFSGFHHALSMRVSLYHLELPDGLCRAGSEYVNGTHTITGIDAKSYPPFVVNKPCSPA